MSKLRLFRSSDLIDEVMSDLAYGILDFYPFGIRSFTSSGTFVDTDKFEIRPKESYKKELTRQKEEELKALETYYERRKKAIKEEIDKLL
jgi:hypothetical protein